MNGDSTNQIINLGLAISIDIGSRIWLLEPHNSIGYRNGISNHTDSKSNTCDTNPNAVDIWSSSWSENWSELLGNGTCPIHNDGGTWGFLFCVIGYIVRNLRINNPLLKLHLSNNSRYDSLL